MILSVVGQKGGTGKSMLSRLLAVELAKQGKAVTLVDLDVAQRTSAEWNEARRLNNLKPAIEVLVVDADDEPDCRTPTLARTYDAIILDAPGFSDELTLQIAGQADLVILPAGPALDDLRPTIRLRHELNAAGIAAEAVAIILNKIDTPAEEKFARDYLRQAGMEAVSAVLHDKSSYRRAADHGQAASEVSHASLRDEAGTLAGKLLERAKPVEQPKRFVLEEGEAW